MEYLQESKFVGIVILIPTNIPKLIVEVVKVVDIGIKRPATLPQVIVEFMYVGEV